MKNILFLIALGFCITISAQNLPKGFVYLSDIDASIQKELRYLGNNNFIGKPIDGYINNCVIVSKETAKALKKVQTILNKKGLSLKIFDAYRPQQAVNHFVKWAKVLNDTLMKQQYYPKVPKSQLFNLGYIASKSGHTRGSTTDLTIIDIKTGKELDMGSPFDFFGIESHPFYKNITQKRKENRMLLRKVMLDNGFKPYDHEWWHFTLKNEPFPKTYFNFPIQ
ncbi:peptidase M15 [Polaribacter reichenbachii]|uniref:D-alanyl-D-alanine dipeptidase n=1 Tax=Polaribacter reichenbachii TaxID=996801 RepID=A0A1B8U576_9FLAO|nr:M15 family metallopeptidase [Polaribacter reichenbachii]APZ47633.1 peptidase M15 [Polaribacter reichenbachii]AUC18273.1 peptidase M15 [Polaribacter reichenbachii]OBY67014.1 peptidase M15 [Polaribacter reichenbachii]